MGSAVADDRVVALLAGTLLHATPALAVLKVLLVDTASPVNGVLASS